MGVIGGKGQIGTILSVCFFFLLTACTGNTQYRTKYDPCRNVNVQENCQDSSIQISLNATTPDKVDYQLGFVEFDDQGQLFDRDQLQNLEDYLLQESSTNNLLLVVFTHGWKHNAMEGDSNIVQFRKILAKLAEAENTLSSPPRNVVGIYLGWRGKSFHLGPLTNLTFWDRKSVAHKVGHGGVAEVLARIEQVRNIDQIMDDKTQGRPTRFVIVGHSFGGALVHSALSQIMMERFIDIKAKAESPRKFSDLVVLINPAFEAMRYATLKEMVAGRTYFAGQKPIMAILTSEADMATKIAFPLGRVFSTFWEKERSDAQEEANRKAIGHYAPFQTHYLAWKPWPPQAGQGSGTGEELKQSIAGTVSKWGQPTTPFPGSELKSLGKTHPLSPYLNIYVSGEIIQGHNEIYDDRLVEFLRHLILLSLDSGEI